MHDISRFRQSGGFSYSQRRKVEKTAIIKYNYETDINGAGTLCIMDGRDDTVGNYNGPAAEGDHL